MGEPHRREVCVAPDAGEVDESTWRMLRNIATWDGECPRRTTLSDRAARVSSPPPIARAEAGLLLADNVHVLLLSGASLEAFVCQHKGGRPLMEQAGGTWCAMSSRIATGQPHRRKRT